MVYWELVVLWYLLEFYSEYYSKQVFYMQVIMDEQLQFLVGMEKENEEENEEF